MPPFYRLEAGVKLPVKYQDELA